MIVNQQHAISSSRPLDTQHLRTVAPKGERLLICSPGAAKSILPLIKTIEPWE